MQNEQMLRLAERLEKATGPDRELDAIIAVALDLEGQCMTPARFRELHRDYGGSNSYADIGNHHPRLPAFTASLDAAMTLVPDGWTVANLCQQDNRKWWAELRRGFLTSYDKVAIGKQIDPATPALALCAAALRSRTGDQSNG